MNMKELTNILVIIWLIITAIMLVLFMPIYAKQMETKDRAAFISAWQYKPSLILAVLSVLLGIFLFGLLCIGDDDDMADSTTERH